MAKLRHGPKLFGVAETASVPVFHVWGLEDCLMGITMIDTISSV